ncbi:MAG TPA: hypothetical protein VFW05_18375 [Verrucomicrobiae bacterium]|jgi:hypothetical protein|nr:hypothetical protein [Verrucomicrobiae bacterium]
MAIPVENYRMHFFEASAGSLHLDHYARTFPFAGVVNHGMFGNDFDSSAAATVVGNGERSFGSAKPAPQHQRRGNTDNG